MMKLPFSSFHVRIIITLYYERKGVELMVEDDLSKLQSRAQSCDLQNALNLLWHPTSYGMGMSIA